MIKSIDLKLFKHNKDKHKSRIFIEYKFYLRMYKIYYLSLSNILSIEDNEFYEEPLINVFLNGPITVISSISTK